MRSKSKFIRRGLVAAALTVAATGATGCEVVDEGQFDLLTYNVAGLPQEISGQRPGTNMQLISPKLEAYDVVLTQEDFDWWNPALDILDFVNYQTRLRAQTTFPFMSERHPGPDAVGIDGTDPERPVPVVGDGLGTLSRFPFGPMDRVPWEHCFGGPDTNDGGAGDCLAMKGFTFTTMTVAEGVDIDVYNLHGEAGRTATDSRMLAENYELLADYINATSTGRPVIVAGDTNLHTTPGHVMEPVHGPIWERFLTDVGLIDVCSIKTCRDAGAIDKVAWRNGGGITLSAQSHHEPRDVFVDGEGRALSDHPPVAVSFGWTRWGASSAD